MIDEHATHTGTGWGQGPGWRAGRAPVVWLQGGAQHHFLGRGWHSASTREQCVLGTADTRLLTTTVWFSP